MRTRPTTRSNQRTHSIANPTRFTSPADAAKPDLRPKGKGQGQQGTTICPACGATVTLRRLGDDAVRELGQYPSDIVVSPHRVGGGRYSVRRGDALCAGTRKMVAA